ADLREVQDEPAVVRGHESRVGALELRLVRHTPTLSPTESVSEQARRREQVEQRIAVTHDRARDEPAARKPEHVAMPRVAARDPRRVPTGERPDDREKVEHQAEDPSPAVVDPQLAADEV